MNIISCIKSLAFIMKIKRLLCILSLMLISSHVYANCPAYAHVSGPATLNIDPAIPVGSVLSTVTLSWPTTETDCAVPQNPVAKYFFKGVGTPTGNLYPTSIPGVSYRGKLPGWSFAGLGDYWPITNTWPNSGVSGIAEGSVIIDFVKTGAIGTGAGFGPALLMEGFIDDSPWFDIYIDNTIIIKPTVPACTVTQSDIVVTLDSASPGELNSPGNTAKEKAFNIPIKCSTEADIALSFSGTVADSANGVFKNTDVETGDTVGIQLLDKNNIPVQTGAGQVTQVGKVNGPLDYPMVARYYALAPGVPAGNVSAIVYATIVYN